MTLLMDGTTEPITRKVALYFGGRDYSVAENIYKISGFRSKELRISVARKEADG